ncbi:hypothetical protein F4802DRAFT_462171 [Xylaria palmicola]|nr:hypothetical protein F4802DRAFT_462171 [Xylaria palmicola]
MSADLFAAFEDPSRPSPPQTRPNPTPAQPASTPFSFASSFNPPVATPSQQRSQPFSASNQFQHTWTAQPSPAPNTRPASVAISTFAGIQPTNNEGNEDDDDGWGDFEVAPGTAPPPAPLPVASGTPNLVSTMYPAPANNPGKQPTRIVRASTLDLVSNSLVDFQEPPTQYAGNRPAKPPAPSVKPQEPKVWPKTANVDPNVLFDADDFEGAQDGEGSDDDFGEFETVSTAPAQPPLNLLSSAQSVIPSRNNTAKKASELLLDLDLSEPISKSVPSVQLDTVQEKAAIQRQELSRPKPPSEETLPTETRANQAWEDDWESFPDLPNQPVKSPAKIIGSTWDWDSVDPPESGGIKDPVKKSLKPLNNDATTANTDDNSWDWDPVDAKTDIIAEIEDSTLPPINIPPPSILLSAFPQLLDQAYQHLYKPVSGQSQSIKDRILSDAKVYDFLRGYLSLAVVAARIIAGRKMRWHRDKFLSQSMSISAAGSKGMKLAGVDKTQAVREDREAADVVTNWKSQIGRLRSIVASVNSVKKSGGRQLKVPEISDVMQVQTAKDVPTAPKACVICGLKRNERLAKIDHEVEDSFGEWWAEHWGHVDCKRFWLQHENALRQR